MQYCTEKQVYEYLNWATDAPAFDPDATSTVETVDTSGTLAEGSVIFLDNNRVISGTLTVYKGTDANTLTALTETTDYTVDLDKAQITITSAGATNIGSDNVYADYQHIKDFIPDSVVSDFIDRNTALIDDITHRTWQPSTAVSEEDHIGKGTYDRKYRPFNLPLLTVTKVEISTTPVGSTPVYTELTVDADYTVDLQTGYITLLFGAITSEGLILDRYPPKGLPDRFRVSYTYGSGSVDPEIERLCVLMTARDLVTSAISKGLSEGVDGFTPRANEVLNDQIKEILNHKTLLLADGF